MVGGKSRKSGGVSHALIRRIKKGGKGGKSKDKPKKSGGLLDGNRK